AAPVGRGARSGPLHGARPCRGRVARAFRRAARRLAERDARRGAAVNPVEIVRGDGPLILGLPHTGTYLPEAIRAKLNARGLLLADTDWHIERLYAGLVPEATTVRATFHRYVVDANRGPDDASLYPGQNTTGLVPTT